jgi:tRNA-splicing ligase RtcB
MMRQRSVGPPKEAKKISDVVWELPASYKKGMVVPARIYGTDNLINAMDEGVFNQVTNVACLPGIQKYAYCMPDGHWGYGFPIGGVAAFDLDTGVISPGGIGFDINCGMRLLTTNLTYSEVKPKLKELIDTFFRTVPAGVGSKGFVKVDHKQFEEIMVDGSKWCTNNGYGWKEDLERTEGNGKIEWADPSKVSDKAKQRGINQLGTLGSGNHYLEVQVAHAENIMDEDLAKKFGIISKEQVVIMVHCGSRGFGHQIGTDYLRIFSDAMKKYNIHVYDRELACAPFSSNEGQDYYKAMACAANMAFANRQVILHRIREGFSKVFGRSAEDMEMNLVYDVANNIAKVEEHNIDGKRKKVVVHRKGSTRAFPPQHEELSKLYKQTGQPVIIGGSMETGSYLLAGTEKAMEDTFGTTAHGSGRTMSRAAAKRQIRGDKLQKDMENKGIYVKAASMSGLAEEAGVAYKDINEVVKTLELAGISKPVCQLKPLGNVKG